MCYWEVEHLFFKSYKGEKKLFLSLGNKIVLSKEKRWTLFIVLAAWTETVAAHIGCSQTQDLITPMRWGPEISSVRRVAKTR